ncbi:MAG: hypothetical protein Q8O41_10125 [Candidatus Methanoperedens sp.]|nr:hypothetical protein [Candidatus Methanoperedens sp.]
MAEVTVKLPEDMGIVMHRHASIDWSIIVAEAIRKTSAELELLDEKVYRDIMDLSY